MLITPRFLFLSCRAIAVLRRARDPRLSYKLQIYPHHDYEECSRREYEQQVDKSYQQDYWIEETHAQHVIRGDYALSVSSPGLCKIVQIRRLWLQPKSRKISLRANRLRYLRNSYCSLLEAFGTLIRLVFGAGGKAHAANCSKPQ
jgi:hypothetical protein